MELFGTDGAGNLSFGSAGSTIGARQFTANINGTASYTTFTDPGDADAALGSKGSTNYDDQIRLSIMAVPDGALFEKVEVIGNSYTYSSDNFVSVNFSVRAIYRTFT